MNYNLNSNIFPISLSELNDYLNRCDITTLGNLNFPNLKKDAIKTLDDLIAIIAYPVLSYQDLTPENVQALKDRIRVLFPNAADKKCFQELLSRIKEKNTPSIPQKEDNQVQKVLENIPTFFHMSTKERLEEIYKIATADSSSTTAHLQFLQTLLNLLLLEEQYLFTTGAYVNSAWKTHEVQKTFRMGCAHIIRVNETDEVSLFKIDEKIDTTEEFALWLQLTSLIDFRVEKEAIYAIFKPHKEPREENIKKLNHLRTQAKHPKTQFLIDKCLSCLTLISATKFMSKNFVSLSHLTDKVNSYRTFLDRISEQTEVFLAPFFHTSLGLYKKLQIYSLSIFNKIYDCPRDLDLDRYLQLTKLIEIWYSKRQQQAELYALVFTTMQSLINSKKEKKRELFQFTKNLLTEGSQTLPEKLDVSSLSPNLYELLKITPPQPKAPPTPVVKPKKVPPAKIAPPKKIKRQPMKEEVVEEAAPSVKPTPLIPCKPFPYRYDKRVTRWLQHPLGQALSSDIFPEYTHRTLSEQKLIHAFHCFNPIVDEFLHLAIQGEWTNKKQQKSTGYAFVAQMTFEGKKYRGIISYAVDGNCYHRCFSEQTDYYTLNKKIEKKLYESDFPTDLSEPSQPSPYVQTEDPDTKVSVNSNFGFIKIKDRHMTIKLFVDIL